MIDSQIQKVQKKKQRIEKEEAEEESGGALFVFSVHMACVFLFTDTYIAYIAVSAAAVAAADAAAAAGECIF
jgi:hypothetical protein